MNKTMTAVGIDMTLDQIRDTINSLTRQGSTANHQIGTLYNHVVDRRLAEIAGYKNAQAYFTAHVKGLSQSTLSVYGAVARNFTEAVCTQYGMGNLREHACPSYPSLPPGPALWRTPRGSRRG